MKEVTVNYEVFTFDELTPEVQAKVLENYRTFNVDFDGWWDPIYEGQKETLKALGFGDVDISFSGFYSQGDGASFTTDTFDFTPFNEKFKIITDTRILKLLFEGKINIGGAVKRTNHHYVHERSTTFNIDIDFYGNRRDCDYENINSALEGVEDRVQDIIVGLNRDIYAALERYNDELTSDEAVKGSIEANDYEFLADGELFTESAE